MTDLVNPTQIEQIVGHMRHETLHYGRAVSDEGIIYILHSKKCLDSEVDLRYCEYSMALDNGVYDVWTLWEEFLDTPVPLGIVDGYLVPVEGKIFIDGRFREYQIQGFSFSDKPNAFGGTIELLDDRKDEHEH